MPYCGQTATEMEPLLKHVYDKVHGDRYAFIRACIHSEDNRLKLIDSFDLEVFYDLLKSKELYMQRINYIYERIQHYKKEYPDCFVSFEPIDNSKFKIIAAFATDQSERWVITEEYHTEKYPCSN